MRRGLFQCLQKGIERRGTEHVNLIDDEDALFSGGGNVAYLIDNLANVFDRVVARGIQFVDVEATSFIECGAAFAGVAGFAVFRRIGAIDGLGQDACACGLSDTTWA